MGFEIERKFLVKETPDNLSNYKLRVIEQGYLCSVPAVRVRADNNNYFLTYKSGGGSIKCEEYNLPITEEDYLHLIKKCDGIIIRKKRYEIPDGNFTIELDIFESELSGLVVAEVEFSSEDEAARYVPPAWMGEDVSLDKRYSNCNLSKSGKIPN